VKLNLSVGDVISTVDGTFEIKKIMPDGALVLQKQFGTESSHMPQDTLLTLHAKRQLTFWKRDDPWPKRAQTLTRYTALDPNEKISARAKIRQLLLIDYDKSPVSLTDKSLNTFIKEAKLPKELDACGWRPSAGTLRRDIRSRSENGLRPIAIMGRRRRSSNVRVEKEIATLLFKSIHWYYEHPARTVGDTRDRLERVIEILNLRAKRQGRFAELVCPSHETVRQWIRRCENYYLLKRKSGEHVARRQYKGSASGRDAKRPLDVVMIDATKMDAFTIVDPITRNVLGRPTLLVAIDVCTRMILGIFITFEPPSIYAIMNCIKNLLTWKQEIVAERFPDIRKPYVACGRPQLLILDNGLENVGASMQDTLHDLGIGVEWAPVRTPEYKAIVERFFDTLNKGLLHKLPGGVPAAPKQLREQDVDPRKQACMTIESLEKLVLQFILEVYQYRPHRGIDDIPMKRWEELTKIHGIEMIDDLSRIDDACGYVKNANLTRDGIKTDGLKFHDSEIVTQLLADLLPSVPRERRRKPTNSVPVKIKIDPGNISEIRVWNSCTNSYQALPNVHKDYSNGMSLWFHKVLKNNAKQNQEAFVSESDRLKARRRMVLAAENAGAIEKYNRTRILSQISSTSTVEVSHAPPRHDGNAPIIEVSTGMDNRADDGQVPKGYSRGGSSRKKKKKETRKQINHHDHEHTKTSSNLLTVQNANAFMARIDESEGWNDND
jgi:putative transposase